jgi:hypothetical protein
LALKRAEAQLGAKLYRQIVGKTGAGEEIRTLDPNLGKNSHGLNMLDMEELFQLVG